MPRAAVFCSLGQIMSIGPNVFILFYNSLDYLNYAAKSMCSSSLFDVCCPSRAPSTSWLHQVQQQQEASGRQPGTGWSQTARAGMQHLLTWIHNECLYQHKKMGECALPFKCFCINRWEKTSSLFTSVCSYRKLIKEVISYKNNYFFCDFSSLDPSVRM